MWCEDNVKRHALLVPCLVHFWKERKLNTVLAPPEVKEARKEECRWR